MQQKYDFIHKYFWLIDIKATIPEILIGSTNVPVVVKLEMHLNF